MFTFNNKKVTKQFYDDIVSRTERIEVHPGKCRYNFRCQMNAAHEAMKKGHKEIAMVVYMEDGDEDPIIHFVNYHKGRYIDNTLGQWSKMHEYYLIRKISANDFKNVQFIFSAYRRTIRNRLSWWLRFTSDVNF